MNEVSKQLRQLRENLHLSQAKVAALIGTTQSAINRYETGQSAPPLKTLMWYADYFDVSMDYIFGRTESPQGKLYSYQPESVKKKVANQEEWIQFVEMCFDPNSPMSLKLKDIMIKMIEDNKN